MEQRSEQWHSLRKTKIGASDAAPILGLSPWKTAHDIFLEKTSNMTTVPFQNEWMKRGIELEPEALQAFENETGYLMSPKVIISKPRPYLMASLDGYEIDGKCAVEIKCPYSDKGHIQVLNGEIPRHYFAQMQHQMYVADLSEIYFCSYRPGHVKPLYIEIVKADEDFISDMLNKEKKFYEEHMLTGIPPEHIEKFIQMSSNEWKLLSDEYKRLDRQEKEASKRKDEIKDLLLQIAGAENAQGNGITLKKIERKGIIDYKKIPELKNRNLEEFRKAGSSFWQVKETNDGME